MAVLIVLLFLVGAAASFYGLDACNRNQVTARSRFVLVGGGFLFLLDIILLILYYPGG